MRITDKNFEDIITNITKKVIEYVTKIHEEQIVIEAICGEKFSEFQLADEILDIEKYIIMGADFPDLSTKEKLIAIKSAINTHYRLTNGILTGCGEIFAYELQLKKNNKEYKILFGIDGTITEEDMKKYL